ncbi:MAG TPA: RNA-binding domain-containing protein [Dehalococcoidia bacterium]|nr:RNA-binding domain-containing protein [Dehalococcoidia bacterium]
MLPEEVRSLITQGEGQQLEFKQSLSAEPQIIEALCGLLNAQGGRVLVGVADDGNVVGIDLGKQTLERLAANIATNIDPQPVPLIEATEIDAKSVVILSVEKRRRGVVYFAKGRAWIRVGRTTRHLSAEEVRQRHLEEAATLERLTDITTITANLTSALGSPPKILGQVMFQLWVEGLSAPGARESFVVGAIEVARDVARLSEAQPLAPLRSQIEEGPSRSPFPSRVEEVTSAIAAGLVDELPGNTGTSLFLSPKGRMLLDAIRLNQLLGGRGSY